MYLLKPVGTPCSKLFCLQFFSVNALTEGTTFDMWNDSALWQCNFITFVNIVHEEVLLGSTTRDSTLAYTIPIMV